MRTITSPERARMAASHADYYLRIEVKDSDDVWRDLTNLSGINWTDGATWTTDLDTAVMTGSITLKREHHAFSLVPLLSSSTINRNIAMAYAPLLDLGRGVRISTAITAHGTAPITGDWKEAFLGYITDMDFASDPMTLTIADLGSRLVDAQIELEMLYSTPAGTLVETIMQQILDDNLGAGTVTLFTPVSPAWYITEYTQARGGIMDAIRTLALQIGWDVRYVYDSSNVFRLTFFSTDRAKTTPDATIGPNEYLTVARLSMSNQDIRNVVVVNYLDGAAQQPASSPPATDPGSIAEFGRRYMEIGAGSSSNIDTEPEATAMAIAAVADLSQPPADQEIEQFFFWPVQLGDLLRYQANAVHYDSDQDWGVIGFTHSFALNTHRSTIRVRGKVAGAYRRWLSTRNGLFTGAILTGPAPLIFPPQGELNAFEDATRDGMIWQQVRFSKETKFIDLYAMESATSPTPIPELSSIRTAYHLQRQDGDQWSGDTVAFIVGIATRANYYRKVIAIGISALGERGPMVVQEVQAIDVGAGPSAPPSVITYAPSGSNSKWLTWTNGDSSAYTILFRNGIGIVLDPGVIAFLDSNIQIDIPHTYQLCHWKNGQTSALAGATTAPPTGGTPDPVSAAVAPSWTGSYPNGSAINSSNFAWTSDPATTEISIEINRFTLFAAWTNLLTFTDVIHVPTGSATSYALPAGSTVQARVRALVNGVYLYSTIASFTVGAPALAAPVFVNGTPKRVNTGTIFSPVYHVHVEWTLSDPTATCYSIDILGATNAAYGAGYSTPTLLHTVTGGFLTSGSYDITTPSIAAVQLRANYTGSASKSSALIQVAP